MADKCPNPTLVPMEPSLIKAYALKAVEGVKKERQAFRDDYVEHILTNVKHAPKRWWGKCTPFTRAEAEHEADLAMAKGSGFYSLHRAMKYGFLDERRQKAFSFIHAANLVAEGQQLWVDIESLMFLRSYQ